ncbi:F-box/WD repeat-containing protein 7, partial [Stegodyphus mimosarum]
MLRKNQLCSFGIKPLDFVEDVASDHELESPSCVAEFEEEEENMDDSLSEDAAAFDDNAFDDDDDQFDDIQSANDSGVLKRKSEAFNDSSFGKKLCKSEYIDSEDDSNSQNELEMFMPEPTDCQPTLTRKIKPVTAPTPPDLDMWLSKFQEWSSGDRLTALDRLIEICEPAQVRHMMNVIEPQFQRDFISLLPKELALYVLSFLEPKDLLKAAQTCRYWRVLAEDNLLWREKCREEGINDVREVLSRRRSRCNISANNTVNSSQIIPSPWKAAYMRQHNIEMNWRCNPIKLP